VIYTPVFAAGKNRRDKYMVEVDGDYTGCIRVASAL